MNSPMLFLWTERNETEDLLFFDDFAAQFFLDSRHLAFQAGLLACAVIDAGHDADAVAIGCQCLETVADDFHHVIPIAFYCRAHRGKLIGQSALVDDIHASGDIWGKARALVVRENGEFKQYHKKFSR